MVESAASVMRQLVVSALLVLALLATALPARAAGLVSLRTGELGALPDASATGVGLVVLGGRPLALASSGAWAHDGGAWTPLAAGAAEGPIGAITSVTGDGARAFALAGAHRVVALSLAGGTLEARALPPLPVPLTNGAVALLGDVLWVAGGDGVGSVGLHEIDPRAAAPAWRAREDAPARGGVTSLIGQAGALWMTTGDALLRWSPKDGWRSAATVAGTVVPGGARATGQAHLVYLLAQGGAAPRLATFHTITSSWADLGDPGATGAVTATALRNGLAWTDGRGRVAFAEIAPERALLHAVDWIVIGVYLIAMLGIGLHFYRKEKRASTTDFFVGGRSIPFWAAGVSLYAANTSSISYIAIPAKSFETNWQYLTNNLVTVLGLVFVASVIVPLLRRLELMSVFQYLENRFHPIIRTLASALFIAVQIGSRMSVILFLPSLAIATMTGLDVVYSILIMGVFTIVYTALGGMKAVIWTDVVQLIVKMGGIFFALGFILVKLRGGTAELLAVAAADHKTHLLDFSFDLTKATVWGFVFLVVFEVVLTFPKDQVLMQRVLSTKSDRDAGRSVWTFAALMIPAGLLFYLTGTALYVFYKSYPERMDPLMNVDATFPLFIAAELPVGIRGLIVAGILAAAMATLSSIMNSVATLASVDFYEKLVEKPDPKVSVRFAEAMTVLTGVAGIGVAWILSRYDVHSLFDVSIELGGLLGGGFAGAYTLGMFTRRANWQGVVIGVVVAITTTITISLFKLIHPFFYLALSIFVCVVVGWLASWLFPAPPPSKLAGLTIHRQKEPAS